MGDVMQFVVEVASNLPLPLRVDGATVLLSVLSVCAPSPLLVMPALAGVMPM